MSKFSHYSQFIYAFLCDIGQSPAPAKTEFFYMLSKRCFLFLFALLLLSTLAIAPNVNEEAQDDLTSVKFDTDDIKPVTLPPAVAPAYPGCFPILVTIMVLMSAVFIAVIVFVIYTVTRLSVIGID